MKPTHPTSTAAAFTATGERPKHFPATTPQKFRFPLIQEGDFEANTVIESMPAGARVAVRPLSPEEARKLNPIQNPDYEDDVPAEPRLSPEVSRSGVQTTARCPPTEVALPPDVYAIRMTDGTQIVHRPSALGAPPVVEQTVIYVERPATVAVPPQSAEFGRASPATEVPASRGDLSDRAPDNARLVAIGAALVSLILWAVQAVILFL